MQIILQEDVEKTRPPRRRRHRQGPASAQFPVHNKIGIQAPTGKHEALGRIRGAVAKEDRTELDAESSQAE